MESVDELVRQLPSSKATVHWLNTLTEQWSEYSADALTSAEMDAMLKLVAIGAIEKRSKATICVPGSFVRVEVVFDAVGVDFRDAFLRRDVLPQIPEWKDCHGAVFTPDDRFSLRLTGRGVMERDYLKDKLSDPPGDGEPIDLLEAFAGTLAIVAEGPAAVRSFCRVVSFTKHDSTGLSAGEKIGESVVDRTKPDNDGDKSKGPRKATVNARMLDKLQNDRKEVEGWSARQWAQLLKCSQGTVKGTKTWKQLMETRKTDSLAMASDRRQGRRGRRVDE